MRVYKACDIRGDAAAELSPELYQRWGQILGARLEPGAFFVVGGDVRPSTPAFLEALIEGLCQAGVQVVDLGVVPTPMVYFAQRLQQAPGGAVVTASHSPPAINGLKWMVGDLPPDEAEVQALAKSAAARSGPCAGSAGERRHLDIAPHYRTWLKQSWGREASSTGGRVVLDPGNGCWAGRCLSYLEQVFPGVFFLAIHDHPDGTFPERGPDCSRPAHLRALSEAVRQQEADLGIAFDGDGDRVTFVDNEGRVLKAEETTWILLQSLGDELRGRPFIYDIKFSDRIAEAARELGAQPRAQRSGHAFIRTSMIQDQARFGAEISGHYFYQELQGGDDGLLTACRMVRYLAAAGTPLADMRRECPPVWMTGDLRLEVEAGEQDEVIQQVQRGFSHCPQSFVDGVRVDFPEGWGLLRKSVTEDKLTCRFEGDTRASLERIVTEFRAHLGGAGDELWEHYSKEREQHHE